MWIDPLVEDQIGQRVFIWCPGDARVGEERLEFGCEQERAPDLSVVKLASAHDISREHKLVPGRIE